MARNKKEMGNVEEIENAIKKFKIILNTKQ